MSTPTKRAAVLFMTGFETVEALIPVDLLVRANLEVVKVSLEETLEVTSNQKVTIKADKLLTEVDLTSFDLVVLPGGRIDLEKYIALEPTLTTLIANSEKTLGAICAAPTALARLGYLEGKTGTCYPAMAQIMADNGVDYQMTDVVSQGNILMGRAAGASFDFTLALIERVVDPETAKRVKEEVYYQV